MRDKVLMLASVASMIDQFNIPNIKLLIEMGYKVDVACNFVEGSTCSDAKIEELKNKLTEMGVDYYQIDFARSVRHIWQNLKAYHQVLSLMKANRYKFIHCHSPIGGVCGRLAGHKTHTKVIYTAHGFHFYKGAPLFNWLYYPVEKYFSRYTGVLITINKEDYARASKKFYAKATYYIPGVGVDVVRFHNCETSKSTKRIELGIPQNALLLLSVGELACRKNHQVVINALGKIRDPNIYYAIAGKGPLKDEYMKLAIQNGIAGNVMLLGPRSDVDELCKAADVFVHPSVREGLGIAPLEGMAAGLPLISSYVNGIKDYTKDGVTGCCLSNPLDVDAMAVAILTMRDNAAFREQCALNNIEIVKKFDISQSIRVMAQIYSNVDYIHD